MSTKINAASFIREELNKRVSEHRLRELHGIERIPDGNTVIKDNKKLINFCSNDYLGLSAHPALTEKSVEFTRTYGTGSSSSRLVSGTLTIHEELENKIADSLGFEAALLFNSGFQANLSIIPALCSRKSLILIDKLCHNSLIQGALLSRASVQRFRHNDTAHLTELIEKAKESEYDRILVVTETVFSMDGDLSPISDFRKIAELHNVMLYSDDAHAFGIFGTKGMGFNAGATNTDIALGTFGKSAGSFGAFAACTNEMKQYLINFASGFIYSTALPPSVIGALDAAFDLIPEMEDQRTHLMAMVSQMRNELQSMGFDTGPSGSQIVPVIIGSEEDAVALSAFLESRGCWVPAIRPPTVPHGSARVRITLSAGHSTDEVNLLTEAFRAWKNR